MAPQNERTFDPTASVVLVGCRGAGKRTLGFLGAMHLRRRLVTEDQYFEKLTGLSRGQYLLKHGKAQFARQNIDVFKHMLDNNRQNCIIECGMSSLSESAQDALLAFSRTNPVVYVHREREQILQLLDSGDAEKLLKADPSHRRCSNLEYYNLLDNTPSLFASFSGGIDGDRPQMVGGPSKLLSVRKDFAKFLDFVTGQGATEAWRESPFSLEAVPPEFRSFSYVLRLRLSQLVDMDLEWEDLEAMGDCIELIIDHWPTDLLVVIARQIALIRRYLGVPIIYHVEENPRSERRRPQEEKDRVDTELLVLGLRLGVDYLSLDLERDPSLVDTVLKNKGRSKIIGNYTYHGFTALPWHDPQQVVNYQRAQSLGCDLVRMCRFCIGTCAREEVERLKATIQNTIADPKPPLIAYDFSVLGVRTPLQTRVLAPVKHPDLENDRDHLATVCTYPNTQGPHFRELLLDPLQFYTLGSNVYYSLSPAMHMAAYEHSNMPHTFQAVTCSTLENLNQISISDTFGGASLAAPFKVAIIPHLKLKSHHATAIGAVNVLLPLRGQSTILDHANARNKAGPVRQFYGDNTDWSAILKCLQRAISPRNYVQPSKTTALVIGAGGMARAAIYALLRLGCRHIFIYNRTTPNAWDVANHFNHWAALQGLARPTTSNAFVAGEIKNAPICQVLSDLTQPWPIEFVPPTMIISCVPAKAIDGNPPADFEMPIQWLKSPTGGAVIELAYDPLVTPFVAQMQKFRDHVCSSWVIVDGLEVVSGMAIEAFELMTGRPAPKRLMKEVCRRTWEEQQRGGSFGSGSS